MSQENVEQIARQIVEGVNSRDVAVLQAASDPDIEYTSRFTAIEGRTYRGHAGWSDYLADLAPAWVDFKLTIEEFVAIEPEKVVALLRVNARARGSSVPIEQRVYSGWQLRAGKVLRGATHPSREEALEAVGLSEQDAHADS